MRLSLANESLKSVKWSAIERVSVQILQMLMGIFLARLVSPSEYGQLALATIFVTIIQAFVEAGFTNALIQKQNRSDFDFNSVFNLSVLTSVLFYGLINFSAPFIARYYNEPELDIVCKWLGLIVITQSFSIVQVAKLSIALDFKSQAKASLLAIIASGSLGILLAYLKYGVWALVVQALLYSLLNTAMLWFYVKWFPKLIFSANSIKSLFKFGSKLMLAGVMHSVYINIYGILIGRNHSLTDVGYFNQANLLSRFPSVSFMAIIGRAIYPIQCSIENDNEILLASNLKYLRMSCYLVFPIMTILALLSEPLIVILLTEKWAATAPLFSILCMAYIFTPIMTNNSQLLLVKGRSDLFLRAEVIKKTIGIIILALTIQHDLYVICSGIVLYNILDSLVIIFYTKKVTTIGYIKQFKAISPHFILTFVMGASIYFIIDFFKSPQLKILVGLTSGCVIYFGLSKIFNLQEFLFIKMNIKKIIFNH